MVFVRLSVGVGRDQKAVFQACVDFQLSVVVVAAVCPCCEEEGGAVCPCCEEGGVGVAQESARSSSAVPVVAGERAETANKHVKTDAVGAERTLAVISRWSSNESEATRQLPET